MVKQDIIFHFNEVENLFHIFAPISLFEARFFFNLSEIIKARLHDLCTKLGLDFESFETESKGICLFCSRLFKLNGSANKGRWIPPLNWIERKTLCHLPFPPFPSLETSATFYRHPLPSPSCQAYYKIAPLVIDSFERRKFIKPWNWSFSPDVINKGKKERKRIKFRVIRESFAFRGRNLTKRRNAIKKTKKYIIPARSLFILPPLVLHKIRANDIAM